MVSSGALPAVVFRSTADAKPAFAAACFASSIGWDMHLFAGMNTPSWRITRNYGFLPLLPLIVARMGAALGAGRFLLSAETLDLATQRRGRESKLNIPPCAQCDHGE